MSNKEIYYFFFIFSVRDIKTCKEIILLPTLTKHNMSKTRHTNSKEETKAKELRLNRRFLSTEK